MWTPSAVFGLDGSREIPDFSSARGNVQDAVQVFNVCIGKPYQCYMKAKDYTFGIPHRLLGKMYFS